MKSHRKRSSVLSSTERIVIIFLCLCIVVIVSNYIAYSYFESTNQSSILSRTYNKLSKWNNDDDVLKHYTSPESTLTAANGADSASNNIILRNTSILSRESVYVWEDMLSLKDIRKDLLIDLLKELSIDDSDNHIHSSIDGNHVQASRIYYLNPLTLLHDISSRNKNTTSSTSNSNTHDNKSSDSSQEKNSQDNSETFLSSQPYRNVLEKLALEIFQFHVGDHAMLDKQDYALTYWIDLSPTSSSHTATSRTNGINDASSSGRLPFEFDRSHALLCQSSSQDYQQNRNVNDDQTDILIDGKDNDNDRLLKTICQHPPDITTVTFLTDFRSPLIVFDTVQTDPNVFLHVNAQHSNNPSMADASRTDLNLPVTALVVYPLQGKHVIFPGNLLRSYAVDDLSIDTYLGSDSVNSGDDMGSSSSALHELNLKSYIKRHDSRYGHRNHLDFDDSLKSGVNSRTALNSSHNSNNNVINGNIDYKYHGSSNTNISTSVDAKSNHIVKRFDSDSHGANIFSNHIITDSDNNASIDNKTITNHDTILSTQSSMNINELSNNSSVIDIPPVKLFTLLNSSISLPLPDVVNRTLLTTVTELVTDKVNHKDDIKDIQDIFIDTNGSANSAIITNDTLFQTILPNSKSHHHYHYLDQYQQQHNNNQTTYYDIGNNNTVFSPLLQYHSKVDELKIPKTQHQHQRRRRRLQRLRGGQRIIEVDDDDDKKSSYSIDNIDNIDNSTSNILHSPSPSASLQQHHTEDSSYWKEKVKSYFHSGKQSSSSRRTSNTSGNRNNNVQVRVVVNIWFDKALADNNNVDDATVISQKSNSSQATTDIVQTSTLFKGARGQGYSQVHHLHVKQKQQQQFQQQNMIQESVVVIPAMSESSHTSKTDTNKITLSSNSRNRTINSSRDFMGQSSLIHYISVNNKDIITDATSSTDSGIEASDTTTGIFTDNTNVKTNINMNNSSHKLADNSLSYLSNHQPGLIKPLPITTIKHLISTFQSHLLTSQFTTEYQIPLTTTTLLNEGGNKISFIDKLKNRVTWISHFLKDKVLPLKATGTGITSGSNALTSSGTLDGQASSTPSTAIHTATAIITNKSKRDDMNGVSTFFIEYK